MTKYDWDEITRDMVIAVIDALIDRNKTYAHTANESYLEHKNLADCITICKTEYCIAVLNLLKEEVIRLMGGEAEND